MPVYITRFATTADGRDLEILLFGARTTSPTWTYLGETLHALDQLLDRT